MRFSAFQTHGLQSLFRIGFRAYLSLGPLIWALIPSRGRTYQVYSRYIRIPGERLKLRDLGLRAGVLD